MKKQFMKCMSLRVLMIETAILIIIAFLFYGCGPTEPSLSQEFILPDSLASEYITWDGSHLWLLKEGFRGAESRYYRLSTSGEIVSSFDAPGAYQKATAIEWDGSHLWTILWLSGDTLPEYPTIFRVTTSGEIISSFSSPVAYPTDIVWDGAHLWIHRTGEWPRQWYKISTSGEILDSFDFSMKTDGAAWDGQYMCCVNHPSRIPTSGRYSDIFRLSTSGEIIDSFRFDDVKLGGLAYDGSDFLVISLELGPWVCKITDF